MATPGVYQSVEKAIIDYLNKGNFNIANQKCGFRLANIFNGLQPIKMAVHQCPARCLLNPELFNRQLQRGTHVKNFPKRTYRCGRRTTVWSGVLRRINGRVA